MKRKELFAQLIAAHDRGFPGLTVELGKRYLAKYPDEAWALIFYGMALQTLARYREARTAYDQALPLLPPEEHERIFRQLGHLEEDQAHIPQAETWYREAIVAKPHDATAYIYLGGMLAKNGRLDEAEECHRQGINCSDGCIEEAYLNLGYVLRAKEQYLEALQAFREALARDPLDTATQEAIADMEQVLFDFPEA